MAAVANGRRSHVLSEWSWGIDGPVSHMIQLNGGIDIVGTQVWEGKIGLN